MTNQTTSNATFGTLYPSDERGRTQIDWLDSRHSFSFGEFYDPQRVGFRSLRVINDDDIGGGGGFPMHGHRDMEIISYIATGSLQHRDSMGNGSVIKPGEIQFMGAGSGVRHSEFNPSPTERTRLLQIWITPRERGLEPTYGQKSFTRDEAHNRLHLLISGTGRDGSMAIRQDAEIYTARLAGSAAVSHRLAAGRGAWLQVVEGVLKVAGHTLRGGDAWFFDAKDATDIPISGGGEFLLFDLA